MKHLPPGTNHGRLARRISTLTLVLGICLAGRAVAQTAELIPPDDNFRRDRNVSVTERVQPGYEQVPISLGGFDLLPSATAGIIYDDNVYAQPTNTSTDGIGELRLGANLASHWSRHFLEATTFAEYDGYISHASENHLVGGATIDGRLDIAHDFYLTGLVRYAHLVEARTDSGAPTFTKSPVQYDETVVQGEISKTFNRVRVQLTGQSVSYQYADAEAPNGAPVIQTYRNDVEYALTGRLEYAVTPDTSLFVEAIGNDHDFRSKLGSPSNFDRDSHGMEVTAGVSTDLTSVIRGEASVGYLNQYFADPRLSGFSGLGARGELEFFPTELTTVTLSGSRTFDESPLASSPIYLDSSVSLQVDHELLRDLRLFVMGQYSEESYIGIARTDDRPMFSFGANYLMNRWLFWKVEFSRLQQRSAGAEAGTGFDDDRASVTATARF